MASLAEPDPSAYRNRGWLRQTMAWQARSAWRKEAGWVTADEQRLAQRQKKLAGGSPGRRIEWREKRLDHGSTE